jgi:hypothetical protein
MPEGKSEYPADILAAAEEAFDMMLCNCTESCGGTVGLRKASIDELAKAIRAERLKTYCKIMDMLFSEGILCEDDDGEVFRVGGAFSSKSVHQRIQFLRKDLEI